MRFVARWLRRLFAAIFDRTQRVYPLLSARPPAPTPRRRVAGPALAAFDSEMLAEANGDDWGPGKADRWQWLVPIGGGPVRAVPVRGNEPPSTPIPPAPALTPPLRAPTMGRQRSSEGPPTSRMVAPRAHPRLVARVRK